MMGILAASLVEIVNKGTPYEIWDSLKVSFCLAMLQS
jgi:hypothetical protein